MRVFIFSFTGLIAIVIALSVWWTGRDLDAERAKLEARRIESISRIGIYRMLSENGTYNIFDVALGKWLKDDSRDFRGFLQREGNAFPAYGRVRSICETEVQKPECWEIVYLEANGREMEVAVRGPIPEPVTDDLVTSGENTVEEVSVQISPGPTDAPITQSQDEEEVTASLSASPNTEAVVVAEPEEAVEPQTDPAPADTGPSSTHQVVPSRVNARQGPGITEPILAVLTKGTELSMLGEQGGWGNFLVMQGEQEGTTAWISLSIVAEIELQ